MGKTRDLFKKTGDTEGRSYSKMGTIRDRNGKDLTEAEGIKKRLQEYTEFSSIQSLSHIRLFATPWTAARQASLSITNSWSLLRLMSIEQVMPSSHLILCRPLLLPPSIFPRVRVFSNESVLRIRWPKRWSFSFSISPSKEYSGLIFFRMDWLDLLAVQGTLKSLLQYRSSKASILRCSAFFIVQALRYSIIYIFLIWKLPSFLSLLMLFNVSRK